MVDMAKYFRDISRGLYSLAVGMGVTFRCMFLPTVTVPYPHQILKMYPRFRGPLELIRDEEAGQPKCVVCLMCQKTCPSQCITVEGEKPEGGKRKVPTRFILDFTTCSLCGLCVESCHFDAIRHSRIFTLASTGKEEFIMDLLKQKKPPEGICP
jgi:NADH-quinone oxidoreductase subunit I